MRTLSISMFRIAFAAKAQMPVLTLNRYGFRTARTYSPLTYLKTLEPPPVDGPEEANDK